MNKQKAWHAAGALLIAGLVPAVASAESFVLSAANWGAKQTQAVEAAGGAVVYGHGPSGVGLVTANGTDFLARAMASKAFQQGAADVVAAWQAPILTEEVVTPGNDRFFPIQWAHTAIDSPSAWAAGCTGDGVRVAVLDGGIFAAHPDLAANVDSACSTSFVAGQPFNNDTGTFWHGTHVAGIVAAVDNTIGVVGVAPDATVMGVKVLHGGSGSFGAIIGGILYAADPAAFGAANCARADIINMSLGATFPRNAANGGGQSLIAALNKAVNFASSQGVLVVSSAGNGATDLGQEGNVIKVPAQSGNGIAVSATGPLGWALGATNFDRPASYSDYGEDLVFVAAPGGDGALPGSAVCTMPTATGTITNFCWVFDLYLSTSRGTTAAGSYSWAAGTSMAAPTVSGVAALILGANPGISLGNLKARLAQATVDAGKIGHDEFYGHGFVNAGLACSN
jgi:lantibiotic leader peptide-processing serine protease